MLGLIDTAVGMYIVTWESLVGLLGYTGFSMSMDLKSILSQDLSTHAAPKLKDRTRSYHCLVPYSSFPNGTSNDLKISKNHNATAGIIDDLSIKLSGSNTSSSSCKAILQGTDMVVKVNWA